MAEIIVTSTADSGTGTLRAAIAAAQDGDVILFDSNVFPVGATTAIYLSSYITVNKSVSIYGGESDGNGGYTSGATKRYYVYRDVEDVKTKVYVTDDNPALDGETLLFELVCRVALDGQSAVRILSPQYQFIYSGIAFNNANYTGYGGAFLATKDEINTVVDCAFNSCTTPSYGGAFYATENSETTFNNCVFADCTSTYGGAFYAYDNCRIYFNGCIFDGCHSTTDGGVVYATGTTRCYYDESVFVNCFGRSGGALRQISTSATNVSNSIFDNCYVSAQGAVLSASSTSTGVLNACIIKNCKADAQGGAIFLAGTGTYTLNDCTISGCNANYGGAFYSTNTVKSEINNCNITNCTANVYAGGVCVYSESQATLNGCVISDCIADTRGGGLYALNVSVATLNACTITGCRASLGGGVYSYNSGGMTIDRCNITGNTSTGTGKDALFDNTAVASISASRIGYWYSTASATITFVDGITTLAKSRIDSTITINDGAALTITDSAYIVSGAAFTSSGRGYLAVGAGIDTSAATLDGVVLCVYGAGITSFEAAAVNGEVVFSIEQTTPGVSVLIEKETSTGWETVSTAEPVEAEKGYRRYRAFDGTAFFVDATVTGAPLWTVEAWGENLGGGGDPDAPNWSVECWAVNEPGYAVEAWAVDPEIDHR